MSLRNLLTRLLTVRESHEDPAPALPDVCDGQEQEAFEQFLRDRKMSTETHPIHWLFLDAKSYAAREAWKAAISYCRKVAAAGVKEVPRG